MKQLLFVISLFVLCLSARAQIDMGVKVGGNVSRFASATPRIGMHAGIIAEIPVFERRTLRTELVLSQKGVRKLPHTMVVNGELINANIDIDLLYLELPLMLQLPLFNNLSVMPGMQIGARINRDIERSDTESIAKYYWDRKFEYSFLGGVTYDFEGIPLSLDGRFTWSFIGSGVDQTAYQIGIAWLFF